MDDNSLYGALQRRQAVHSGHIKYIWLNVMQVIMNLVQDVIIQMHGDGDQKQQLHEENYYIRKATLLVA